MQLVGDNGLRHKHCSLTGNCDHNIYAIYQRHLLNSCELFLRESHDSRETNVEVSHDSRKTFVRVSHDSHGNVAQFYSLTIKSQIGILYVVICIHMCISFSWHCADRRN